MTDGRDMSWSHGAAAREPQLEVLFPLQRRALSDALCAPFFILCVFRCLVTSLALECRVKRQ